MEAANLNFKTEIFGGLRALIIFLKEARAPLPIPPPCLVPIANMYANSQPHRQRDLKLHSFRVCRLMLMLEY